MRAGLLSKDDGRKAAWLRERLAALPGSSVVYVRPKNRAPLPLERPALLTTYEELTDTDVWLRVNSLLDADTAVVLENPSRYPRVSSEKVRHLRRLTMQAAHVLLVDVVPFTLSVEYLYTPMAYLGREILGYAHYYAFRENYHEKGPDGAVRRAHDFDVLAAKVAPHLEIDYPRFLAPCRHTLRVESTGEERAAYAAKRQQLFDADMPGPKVVTRLADLAHAFESRLEAALGLVAGLEGRSGGKVLVLTNLASYAAAFAARARARGLRRVVCASYASARPVEGVTSCVYLEAPIVKSYLLLDVESRLPEGCEVWHVRGDTKVDAYLHGLLESELAAIDGFTKELYRVRRGL